MSNRVVKASRPLCKTHAWKRKRQPVSGYKVFAGVNKAKTLDELVKSIKRGKDNAPRHTPGL